MSLGRHSIRMPIRCLVTFFAKQLVLKEIMDVMRWVANIITKTKIMPLVSGDGDNSDGKKSINNRQLRFVDFPLIL